MHQILVMPTANDEILPAQSTSATTPLSAAGAVPAPLPLDENSRLAALLRCDVLDTASEDSYDEVAALAGHICQTPVALISLVDRNRQWFKSKVGLEVDETSRDVAFCAYAILDDQTCVIPDARLDRRFATNPLVTGEPFFRFYAGAPLVTRDGFRLGTLCVIDYQPRRLDPAQLRALKTLSRQVALQIELQATLRENVELQVASQASEEKFKRLFDQMQDIAYRADLDGTIDLVSPSVARYGYSANDLVGSAASALCDRAEGDRILSELRQQGSLNDFEISVRHKDGTPAQMSLTTQVVPDSEDRPVAIEGILRDIGERKHLDRQRQEFVAMLAHDIRNPTMAIAGYVDLALEDEDLSESARDFLQGAARNVTALESLVTSYLDSTKIEAGMLTLNVGPTCLGRILGTIHSQFEAAASQRCIQLVAEIPPDLPELIADLVAIERIFTNLIRNALKFTPDGGSITMRARAEIDAIQTSITDSGPGVAAKDVEKIFQRYGQTGSEQEVAGTGLGLFIARSLVELHGGHIGVENAPHGGAIFTVSLPTEKSR